MHQDLKAACTQPSAYDLRAQQRKLNTFLREYNQLRPHEALHMATPAKTHQYSNKPFPERISKYDYPAHMKVMWVCNNGSARLKSYYWVYMSRGLIGRHVGAEDLCNGIWRIYYRIVFLGYFNEKEIREKEKSIRLSTNLV